MRDIGRIEKRVETAEYYTQLSLLETAAQNLQIQDANGFDRFKNGFVVDNFTGHNIGDVGNKDYKVSIDYAKGELISLWRRCTTYWKRWWWYAIEMLIEQHITIKRLAINYFVIQKLH